MSTAVLPTLKGRGWDITKTPIWNNSIEQSLSGKELRINNGWSYPRYQWDLTFPFLRSDSINAELQSLLAFYNARNGSYDSFLYSDLDDNSVTMQSLGIGDGATLAFQLKKNYGGFVEPVFAPNTVSTVYVDGVSVSSAYWSVSNWGTSTPGILTFTSGHAPANGKAVAATFSYYFPVRFIDDKLPFTNFFYQWYSCSKLSFISIK